MSLSNLMELTSRNRATCPRSSPRSRSAGGRDCRGAGGKQITKTIKLGRLEENEKQIALAAKHDDTGKKATASPVEKALGMQFSSLTDDLRQKFAIKNSVASGVVITNVDPNPAPRKSMSKPAM